MFYQNEVIFVIYVDDGIFASPSYIEIYQAIMEIAAKFGIEGQGDLDEYIDVNMDSLPNGNIKLLHPHLID